jgi:hypothetical protein
MLPGRARTVGVAGRGSAARAADGSATGLEIWSVSARSERSSARFTGAIGEGSTLLIGVAFIHWWLKRLPHDGHAVDLTVKLESMIDARAHSSRLRRRHTLKLNIFYNAVAKRSIEAAHCWQKLIVGAKLL